jgi:hypothetical protein
VLEYLLYVGLFGYVILFLINRRKLFFAGYSTSYALDRAMVSTSLGGSVGAYSY